MSAEQKVYWDLSVTEKKSVEMKELKWSHAGNISIFFNFYLIKKIWICKYE